MALYGSSIRPPHLRRGVQARNHQPPMGAIVVSERGTVSGPGTAADCQAAFGTWIVGTSWATGITNPMTAAYPAGAYQDFATSVPSCAGWAAMMQGLIPPGGGVTWSGDSTGTRSLTSAPSAAVTGAAGVVPAPSTSSSAPLDSGMDGALSPPSPTSYLDADPCSAIFRTWVADPIRAMQYAHYLPEGGQPFYQADAYNAFAAASPSCAAWVAGMVSVLGGPTGSGTGVQPLEPVQPLPGSTASQQGTTAPGAPAPAAVETPWQKAAPFIGGAAVATVVGLAFQFMRRSRRR